MNGYNKYILCATNKTINVYSRHLCYYYSDSSSLEIWSILHLGIWVNFRNKLNINSIFNYIKKEWIFIKHFPIFWSYLIRNWWLIYELAIIEMSSLISFVRMLKRFCLCSSNQISKSHVPQIKFAYHVLKKGYSIDG